MVYLGKNLVGCGFKGKNWSVNGIEGEKRPVSGDEDLHPSCTLKNFLKINVKFDIFDIE